MEKFYAEVTSARAYKWLCFTMRWYTPSINPVTWVPGLVLYILYCLTFPHLYLGYRWERRRDRVLSDRAMALATLVTIYPGYLDGYNAGVARQRDLDRKVAALEWSNLAGWAKFAVAANAGMEQGLWGKLHQ